jgi:hypothetical protein
MANLRYRILQNTAIPPVTAACSIFSNYALRSNTEIYCKMVSNGFLRRADRKYCKILCGTAGRAAFLQNAVPHLQYFSFFSILENTDTGNVRGNAGIEKGIGGICDTTYVIYCIGALRKDK